MRLSWNEVRARAAQFAHEWKDAAYEKGETQSFYNDFFGIFGVRCRSVARYEQHVRKLDNQSGFIDLFWPGVLLVEQKSAGGLVALHLTVREESGPINGMGTLIMELIRNVSQPRSDFALDVDGLLTALYN